MIASLGLILLCQLIGEVFVRGLGLPMPGPVIGLLVLLLLLLARDRFPLLARGPLQGGIMGAIVVTPLMNRAGITDFRARGFAEGSRRMASARRGRFRSMRWPACFPE